MGPIKKKGARSFWGKNKRKCEKKHTSGATWRMKHELKSILEEKFYS